MFDFIMGGGQRKVFFALQGGVSVGTSRHVKTDLSEQCETASWFTGHSKDSHQQLPTLECWDLLEFVGAVCKLLKNLIES